MLLNFFQTRILCFWMIKTSLEQKAGCEGNRKRKCQTDIIINYDCFRFQGCPPDPFLLLWVLFSQNSPPYHFCESPAYPCFCITGSFLQGKGGQHWENWTNLLTSSPPLHTHAHTHTKIQSLLCWEQKGWGRGLDRAKQELGINREHCSSLSHSTHTHLHKDDIMRL